ncbi:MAG: carboxypeptidase regulatory-like domain-containing protein [Melioribacteraceae bacterium]|nr:carboxypeptidase regulatory-like domain-containing protein [Melioribacteraceae bacterium]MCF8356004.1 carboxypeptidase regulatory-like domain-containing protein [Melioribacteraceae bacterium]MCF8394685.1 carboxypeptidase regulatory-like domain-containing protein [Melioribacteraceae bacterium]MCF8420237.1 carboxypeptidase regulatory-like domain-containing protein [Melioribacteraceae bacterium]
MLRKILPVLTILLMGITSINAEIVSGQVTSSSSSNPIEGAVVVFSAVDSNYFGDYSATTNFDGMFEVDLPALNTDYLVQINHPQYHTGTFGPVYVNDGRIFGFQLTPINDLFDNHLAGTIYDSESLEPLAGAEIMIQSPPGSGNFYVTNSGDDGNYIFESITPGFYLFHVFHPNYIGFSDTITIEENSEIDNFDVYISQSIGSGSGVLTGLVYISEEGSDPEPVPNAEVWAHHAFLTISYLAQTNSDGIYTFDELPSGEYFISVDALGYNYRSILPVQVLPDSTTTFDINLAGNQPPGIGTIEGQVYFDEIDIPVDYAMVHFIPNFTMPPLPINYTVSTDDNGDYSADLPAGDYFVMVEYYSTDSLFFSYQEYYDDVQFLEEATPVTITENNTTTGIDFGIPAPVVNNITISGNVTDDLGNPLENALIEIMHTYYEPGIFADPFYAETDSEGNYSAEINYTGYSNSFIAGAHKNGYRSEWYDNQPEIFLADVITIDSSETEITDINFSLTQLGNPDEYSISGSIYDDEGTPLTGAFIIAFGADNGMIGFGLSGSEGNYSVGNLPEGNYYVLFYAEGYAPEFYDNAIMWEDAATVLVTGDVSSIDAYLAEVNGGNGAGVLSGIITSNTGSPLSGVMVSVLDQFNNVVDYTMSNSQGNYSIQGLGSGDFDIIVSKVKFNSENNSLHTNLDEGQEYEMNFNLTPSATYVEEEIKEIIPDQFTLKNNYPNPFNPTTTIGFDIPTQSYVKLTVYNLIGEEITTLVNKTLDAGTYNYTFDASNLNSGIYFYQLQAGEFNSVRKMILMK